MKINQETLQFKPITITLETRDEAKAFINIIEGIPFDEYDYFSKEREIIIELSDGFGDSVVIPFDSHEDNEQ